MGRERTLASKLWVRLSSVVLFFVVLFSFLARPALAAIKLGTAQLSHITDSPKVLESVALLLFGGCFLVLAFLVRRLQPSAE